MTTRAIEAPHRGPLTALRRTLTIGSMASLTVVDLFATQAILPALAATYRVTPAAMGLAVNASTIGMAVAGLAVGLLGRRTDRRRAIVLSLLLLAIPTALLAVAPNLPIFTLLRIAQGLCMASAFTLTLAHLGETCSSADAGGAFAAYIAGNVASNLIGRLLSAGVADHFGLASNFHAFAALNLAGAALAYATVRAAPPMHADMPHRPAEWLRCFADAGLRASFAIGFCILFAFIGTFTYVNFVLVAPPLSLSSMGLGLVYTIFLPAMVTTSLAGRLVLALGTRSAFWGAVAVAALGLPLLLTGELAGVLVGLALVGIGTFFAQAVATSFVGRTTAADKGASSGIYLASYFAGGLAGTALLGQAFDRLGWGACVAGIALALGAAAALARRLEQP